VVVHQTDPAGEVAIQAVRSLTARGLTPDRIVVAHAAAWPRHETFHAVLDTGCLIAVDTLGLHGSLGPVELPSFRGYLDLIVRLVDDGFADQVLVSQDVAHKRHLRAYGGVGYDHVLVDVAPRLRSLVGSKTVETILTDNPRRLLERIPCAA
jgi:phosphotriesterase-related protein